MRKLANVCAAFSLAVFLSQYLLEAEEYLVFAAASLALCGLSALVFKGPPRPRLLLITLGLCAGFLYNGLYMQLIYGPAMLLDGKTVMLSGTVADYPGKTANGGSLVVLADAGGPFKTKTVLYTKAVESALRPGDEIKIRAEITLNSSENSFGYNLTKGVFLYASAKGPLNSASPGKTPLRYVPAVISQLMREKITELYPEKYAGFLCALLTGSKELINGDELLVTRLGMTGLSHVIAVSGMHVSFLANFLWAVVPNRRRFALIAAPALLLFMLVAGSSPSIVRACFMNLLLLAAPMLRRENDSLTSMAAILAVLLIINPFSAKSIGLQLSFAATLGMVLFSGALRRRMVRRSLKGKPVKRRVREFFVSGISSTLSALIFTTPLTAIYFGMASVVAPLTNLLCLWAVSAAFAAGLSSVLLGFLWLPLGMLLSYPVRLALLWVFTVVDTLAGFRYAAVFTTNPLAMCWLALVYAMFTACALSKRRISLLLPASASVLALCLCLTLWRAEIRSRALTFTLLDVGQGCCAVATDGESTVVVDCGGDYHAGSAAAQYICSLGEDAIDCLLLTHSHADHVNGVEALSGLIETDVLIMPEPGEGEERVEAESIPETRVLSEYSTITVGNIKITAFPVDDDTKCLCYYLTCGGFGAWLSGDLTEQGEAKLMSRWDVPDADVLVVGHHGSKYSSSSRFLEKLAPEAALVPVGENSYGHPAPEAMARLAAAGAEVYRTDENGNITIKVD